MAYRHSLREMASAIIEIGLVSWLSVRWRAISSDADPVYILLLYTHSTQLRSSVATLLLSPAKYKQV